MSRPRFLADEDWRYEIVTAVRWLEPTAEIVTVRELGRAGRSDADLLAFAHAGGWVVLSHDVNTLKAEASRRVADGRGIAGVLLASQSALTRPVAESLVLIWAASDAAEWVDRIDYLPL